MDRRHPVRPVQPTSSAFAGFRFPSEAILIGACWYLRYGPSYRDLEELLAESGIAVDHMIPFQRIQQFTHRLIETATPFRHSVASSGFVNETYVNVAESWRYTYRAVDQNGQIIDVFMSKKRDRWGYVRTSLDLLPATAISAGRPK